MPSKKLKTQSVKGESKPTKKMVVKKPKVNLVTKTPVAKQTKRKNKLEIDIYDIKGRVVEAIALPQEIFGAKINNQLMSQAVRVYLANQRRGTASTKTRGEVAGSTRKIQRQKGTGRARHGSIRAPIFVHGGVVFGPKPKDYSLKLSKKMRKVALFSALSAKVKDGGIKVVSGLEKITPKTKFMTSVLQKLGLLNKNEKILLVLPKKLEEIQRAARNIQNVEIIYAYQLNTYDILRNKTLFLLKDSIVALEKHFLPKE